MSLTVDDKNPGIRDILKERTRQAHLETEEAMDLMSPTLDLERYRRILRGFLDFHSAFEEFLEMRRAEWPHAVAFYLGDRRKKRWVGEDLEALGEEALPRPEKARAISLRLAEKISSEARLWAAMYVIEGSTMGGQVLHGRVAAALKLSDGKGTRYFRSYQSEMGKQWMRFLSALNELTLSPRDVESAVEAAHEVFSLFKEIGVADGSSHSGIPKV